MTTVEKISVALPAEMLHTLKTAVDQGDYSSVSEAIREALRSWTFRRKLEELQTDELRTLIREGIDSGEGIPGETVFAHLRARYAACS